METLNFGSLNIDHVYEVDHFVRPGETIQTIDIRTAERIVAAFSSGDYRLLQNEISAIGGRAIGGICKWGLISDYKLTFF
jgi:hypothetical protein